MKNFRILLTIIVFLASALSMGKIYFGRHNAIESAFDERFTDATIRLTPVWTVQAGTPGFDYGNGIAEDSTGNIYITGSTGGPLDGKPYSGGRDVFLSKYHRSGILLRTILIGSSGYDCGYGVETDENNNVYITGNYNNKILISKYDQNLNLIWSKPEISTGGEGLSITADSLGYVYVTGYTSGALDGNSNKGGYDIFISKYFDDGTLYWTKQPGTTSADRGWDIAVSPSGDVIVTGDTEGSLDGNTSCGSLDAFLTCYDSAGNRKWTKQFGTSTEDYGSGITVDSSGNIYLTGTTWGALKGQTNLGGKDYFIAKYSPEGDIIWLKQDGCSYEETALDIALDRYNNLFLTGASYGSLDGTINAGAFDIYFIKYDISGNHLWSKLLGGSSHEKGERLLLNDSGNAYIIGYTWGSLYGNTYFGYTDIFLMKLDELFTE